MWKKSLVKISGQGPGGRIVAQIAKSDSGHGLNSASSPRTLYRPMSAISAISSLPAAPDKPLTPAVDDSLTFKVHLTPDGRSFDAPAHLPLLQAAELAGLTLLASSCRNGTCRTCICRLSSGQVSYRIEWPGLSAEEKQEGYLLPCVAHALSDLVIELPF